MADDIPRIPKSTSLLISSGNIVHWNRLKQKPKQGTTEELSECVSSTLKDFLEEADSTQLQYVTDLKCIRRKFNEKVPGEERGDLKLTVKLFLCSLLDPSFIKDAIELALEELNTEFIDQLLIAFPDGDITCEEILPYWKMLQTFVENEKENEVQNSVNDDKEKKKEKVLTLGLADLDKDTLEQLYDAVETKPVVNQVNLESCCVMPKDLVEYAKEKDITLLTHNDPKEVIPTDRLQDVIRAASTDKDGDGWEPLWVLRYSTLVKCRGIIKSKGYLLKAVRERKRK